MIRQAHPKSAESARVSWVALRSIGGYLAELRIAADNGQSMLRHVRMPRQLAVLPKSTNEPRVQSDRPLPVSKPLL